MSTTLEEKRDEEIVTIVVLNQVGPLLRGHNQEGE